jgi:hypothetical protein
MEIETFFGPVKWHRAVKASAIWGPKKSRYIAVVYPNKATERRQISSKRIDKSIADFPQSFPPTYDALISFQILHQLKCLSAF